MSAELAQLQEDRDQYQEQLDLVLGSLSDDPGNAELVALRDELQSALDIIDESLEALKQAAKEAPPAPQKQWQSSKSASAGHRDKADDNGHAPVVYKVNESILARWVTGDKAFYPARIMSVTGSSTAPMYTVKFKSYDTIETLRARDIKPVAASSTKTTEPAASSSSASNKRKAEGSTETSSAPPTPTTPAPPSGSSTPAPPPPSLSAQGQYYQHPPPPPPPPGSGSAVSAPPAPPAPPAPLSYPSSAPAQPPPPPQAPRVFGSRAIDRFSSGVVSSAAAQIYPQAVQQQEQQQQQQQHQQQHPGGFSKFGSGSSAGASGSGSPAVLGEEPPAKKFKKIKATKQLEAGKSKWQEFSTKGKATKGVKKDSMFRTPDGVQGRVGFIGSGQAMRKDATRSRHIYQTNEDLD